MKLVKIGDINPSTYNPRKADEDRLGLIELSLSRMGFLLPIYTSGTEIISGHQRHLVATRLGATRVPVVDVGEMDLEERKKVNIVFNRATNDMEGFESGSSIRKELHALDLFGMAEKVPPVDWSDPASFAPCMSAQELPLKQVLDANSHLFGLPQADALRAAARPLYHFKIRQPIVVRRSDLRVVNGAGRLLTFAKAQDKTAPVVIISDESAELAEALLNRISMDFDINERYRDLLRHSSFRRRNQLRGHSMAPALGLAYTMRVMPRSGRFDIGKRHREWIEAHGDYCLDFGAGHMVEGELLGRYGVRVVNFEPFFLPSGDSVDIELSKHLVSEFLDEIAKGREFTSAFSSSVLNSIPFDEDRRHYLAILAALCGTKTTAYIVAPSVQKMHIRRNYSKSIASTGTFALNYEPNTTLGDVRRNPKVQHFFTLEEMHSLLSEHFAKVNIGGRPQFFTAMASRSKVSPERLARAIEFEFDLPYADGSRMGLVEKAKRCFSARLGLAIP